MSKAIEDLFRGAIALNNKVVAEVVEKKEKQTDTGLWLAGEAVNQAMEHFRIGKVLSSDHPQVKVGDEVIYLRFHGSEAGENLVVLEGTDIVGVVNS